MNEIIVSQLPISTVESPLKIAEQAVGEGTLHPIGFSLTDMMFYFWQVKKFQVSINSFSAVDPFLVFANAGGITFDIFGALQGLNAVEDALSEPDSSLFGKTHIEDDYHSEIINPLQIQGGCGFRHRLMGGLAELFMDFSKIILKDGLYYPHIFLTVGLNSSLLTYYNTDPNLKSYATFIEGNLVDFDGRGFIPVYCNSLNTLVYGKITPADYF